MASHLYCLLVIAITVWHSHAKPLIEEPTFSEIELVAEDSQPDEIYEAAPAARPKRAPQYFGNNGIYTVQSSSRPSIAGCSVNGCGGSNIFGFYNNVDETNRHNDQEGDLIAIVVNKKQHNDNSPLIAVIVSDDSPLFSSPASSRIVNASSQSSSVYQNFKQYHHKYDEAAPPRPSQTQPPRRYYDYISGHHNYPPPPPPPISFHAHNPFGFHSGPPFRGPTFGGFADFNRGPPPNPSLHSSSGPAQVPTPPHTAITERPVAILPSSIPKSVATNPTFAPSIVAVTSATATTTTTTTAEPVYDIDIRIGD